MPVSPIMPVEAIPRWAAVRLFRRRWRIGRPVLRVREQPLRYEDEGSEWLSLGSITVGAHAWWSVALTVPDRQSEPGDDALFVRFERHGARPAGYRGSIEAHLSVPCSE